MRPSMMSVPGAAETLSFIPAAGVINASGEAVASATINASSPVKWNWSAAGSLPTSSVVNGGVASSITFTLRNTSKLAVDKSCTITVTCDGQTWTINLDTTGGGV